MALRRGLVGEEGTAGVAAIIATRGRVPESVSPCTLSAACAASRSRRSRPIRPHRGAARAPRARMSRPTRSPGRCRRAFSAGRSALRSGRVGAGAAHGPARAGDGGGADGDRSRAIAWAHRMGRRAGRGRRHGRAGRPSRTAPPNGTTVFSDAPRDRPTGPARTSYAGQLRPPRRHRLLPRAWTRPRWTRAARRCARPIVASAARRPRAWTATLAMARHARGVLLRSSARARSRARRG